MKAEEARELANNANNEKTNELDVKLKQSIYTAISDAAKAGYYNLGPFITHWPISKKVKYELEMNGFEVIIDNNSQEVTIRW